MNYPAFCRPLGVAAAVLLLVGCASSRKMFEEAGRFEAQGDYLKASHEYIDVLEREPEWSEARTRLEIVGPLAVDSLIARAHRAEAASRYPDAVRELDRLDGLREAASGVGVHLKVPEEYAEYRQSMVAEAIAFYLDDAAAAVTGGRWNAALAAYDRALRYGMPAARRDEINMLKAELHLRWAEAELDEDNFRTAYDHAEQALEIAPGASPLADRLMALQEHALDYGTRFVALLPLMSTPEWRSEAPRALLPDLDAILNYDYWTSPPLFVETIDAGDVRRAVRDLGLSRSEMDRRDASRLARVLNADYAVLGEMRRYKETEDVRKEESKRVRVRGSRRDTTYVLRTIRVDLEMAGRFFLIDPSTDRVVAEFNVSASDEAEYRRGFYNGDVGDLDLSYREQSYFGGDMRADVVRDAQDGLLEELSEQISRRAFEAVVDRID